MSSMKTRLHNARAKFLRRSSGTSTATRSIASSAGSVDRPGNKANSTLRKSISLSKLPEVSSSDIHGSGQVSSGDDARMVRSEVLATGTDRAEQPQRSPAAELQSITSNNTNTTTSPPVPISAAATTPSAISSPAAPALTLEAPTPVHPEGAPPPLELTIPAASAPTPAAVEPPATDALPAALPPVQPPKMPHRKIWVKRPHASATLVQIREDDLVDDVRDMILKKYANSLGRSFDAPDVTLRIVPRDPARTHERTLGPEEEMCRTLDTYFPGGQTVNEALIIDVPQRRTPKPSSRVPVYHDHHDDARYTNTEYFPPMPVVNPSPSAMSASHHERIPLTHAPHSIAVLSTGHLPSLPSPGGTRRLHQPHRPKYARHNTASPTTLGGGIPSAANTRPPNRPRHDSSASEAKNSATSNNPIPTPPASTDPNTRSTSNPPTPRVASPQPMKDSKKRRKKAQIEPPSLPAGLLDGSVPPINVLIVEDNIINLRVLGAFMQRLKVRWQRAMNGKEAVTKWKAGGFHLVLMDIQLPVMNGLEATKEIRRLERVNSIGVFSSGSSEAPNNRLQDGNGKGKDVLDEDDKLGVDKGLFKSPVIIVALTASSLQSDRHEALAAGCNDFLTKPVNFVWLERKVKEWGCMQALIDFDGWRKWKDFADTSEPMDGKGKMSASFTSVAPKKKDVKLSPTLAANPPEAGGSGVNGVSTSRKEEEKEKKSKRKSLGVVPPPVLPEENENGTPDADGPSS